MSGRRPGVARDTVHAVKNRYDNQVCSIAGALEIVGERCSLLIVRDVLLGLRLFDELQADLGTARNVAQTRLTRLVDEGVLERNQHRERPRRFEYRLTAKGLGLWPIILVDDHRQRRASEPAGAQQCRRFRRVEHEELVRLGTAGEEVPQAIFSGSAAAWARASRSLEMRVVLRGRRALPARPRR